MSNRDIARRLIRLEADRHGGGVRYVVSDRLPTDEEWQATKGERDFSEPEAMSQILMEAEWVALHCE